MKRTQQQNLFELEPLPAWEEDNARDNLVAGVIFPTGPDRVFEYATPDSLRDSIACGRRVRAPFGRAGQPIVGWCVSRPRSEHRGRLKQISEIVDSQSLLSSSMLRLTRWMADRYLSTWGQALETVLPAAVREQAGAKRVRQVTLVEGGEVAGATPASGLPAAGGRFSPAQAAILKLLADRRGPIDAAEIISTLNCTTAPLSSLKRKGLITIEWRHSLPRVDPPAIAPRESSHVLNADQQRALSAMFEAISSGRQETLLIHGVTGSGKTEVYIQAIQEVVRYGRQAIVLVPEISLTPQTLERFAARFDRVAVLHSHLRDAERHAHWRRIAAGEVTVVVGARSAVFAPTPNLGLIVLDEEHEATFKQEKSPRYHAREVALWRARELRVPLVLGSATPSLESWLLATSDQPPRGDSSPPPAELGAQRAGQSLALAGPSTAPPISPTAPADPAELLGVSRLIEMPCRVLGRPLPDVATIDLRTEFQDRRTRGALSRPLQQAIDAALRDGGQVILLLNRRGYSTHIQCPKCGYVAACPHCELPLTHHLHGNMAICHYCEYHAAAPAQCPECRFAGIRYAGFGTQKLEAEVAARFPGARLLRMDTDTMKRPDSHDRALAKFRRGEVDVLLGTQMIAKGLDFPRVTLVGVVNADTSLHLPDFRAAERTFQLVTQVAGRTGRGAQGGRVLVQTFSPDHPAIRAAVRHDYAMFARQELPIRQALNYPPYAEMARVIVRGPEAKRTQAAAHALVDLIKPALARLTTPWRILGPAPAPMPKLRGLLRFHFQTHAVDGEAMRSILRESLAAAPRFDEIQWAVDVDPFDMM